MHVSRAGTSMMIMMIAALAALYMSRAPTRSAEDLGVEHEDVGDGEEGGEPCPQLNGNGAAPLCDAEVPVA